MDPPNGERPVLTAATLNGIAKKQFEDVKNQEVNPKEWEARCRDIFQQLAGLTDPSIILITDDRIEELVAEFVPKKASDEVKKVARTIPEALAVFTPIRLMAAVVYKHDQQSIQMAIDSKAEEPSPFAEATEQQFYDAIFASASRGAQIAEIIIQADIRTRMNVYRFVENHLAAMKEQNGNQGHGSPCPLDDIDDDLGSDDGGSPRDQQGRGRPKNVRLEDAITSSNRELLSMQPHLRNEEKFTSLTKYREMMIQGRALRKLHDVFECDRHPKLPIFDFLTAIDAEGMTNVSEIPTCFWHILRSCLVQTPGFKRFIDNTKLFTDPNGFIADPSRADLIDDIRSLHYMPGMFGVWSLGMNSTYSVQGHTFSPEVSGLKVGVEEVTRAADKLELSDKDLDQLGMIPHDWVVVMKFVCGYIARNLDLLDKVQLLQFNWLTTVSSSERLAGDMQHENRQTWEHGDQVMFAALMDNTPGRETYALAAFEAGGKIDGSATIHIINHYNHPEHDWVEMISQLFPADYPIQAKDIVFHATIPGAQGHAHKSDSQSRLNTTGMLMLTDFVYLVLTGNQYEGETMPPVTVMRRKILLSIAEVFTSIRRKCRNGDQ